MTIEHNGRTGGLGGRLGGLVLAGAGALAAGLFPACSFNPPSKARITGTTGVKAEADAPAFSFGDYFSISSIKEQLGASDDSLAVYDYREAVDDTQTFLIHYRVDPIKLQVDPESFNFQQETFNNFGIEIPLPDINGAELPAIEVSLPGGVAVPAGKTITLPVQEAITLSTVEEAFTAVIGTEDGGCLLLGPSPDLNLDGVSLLFKAAAASKGAAISGTRLVKDGERYWKYDLSGKTISNASSFLVQGSVYTDKKVSGAVSIALKLDIRLFSELRVSAIGEGGISKAVNEKFQLPVSGSDSSLPLVKSVTFTAATDPDKGLTQAQQDSIDNNDYLEEAVMLGIRLQMNQRIDNLTLAWDFESPEMENSHTTDQGTFEQGIILLASDLNDLDEPPNKLIFDEDSYDPGSEMHQDENHDPSKYIIRGSISFTPAEDKQVTLYNVDATQSSIEVAITAEPIFEWDEAEINLDAIAADYADQLQGTMPSSGAGFDLSAITSSLNKVIANIDDIGFEEVGLYFYLSLPQLGTTGDDEGDDDGGPFDDLLRNVKVYAQYEGAAGEEANILKPCGEDAATGGFETWRQEHLTKDIVTASLPDADYTADLTPIFNARPQDLKFSYELAPPKGESITIENIISDGLALEHNIQSDILIKLPLSLKVVDPDEADGDTAHVPLELNSEEILGDTSADMLGRSGPEDDSIEEYLKWANSITLDIIYNNNIGLDGLTVSVKMRETDGADTAKSFTLRSGSNKKITLPLKGSDLQYPVKPVLEVKLAAVNYSPAASRAETGGKDQEGGEGEGEESGGGDGGGEEPEESGGGEGVVDDPLESRYALLSLTHPTNETDLWGIKATLKLNIKVDVDYELDF